MGWREDRRLDEAASAEQARFDAVTAAQVEALRAQTRTETRAAELRQRQELRRDEHQAAQQARDRSRARRGARVAAARGWVVAHTVDLLIYPLAGVSAVMAVPAMATFGHEVYGTAAGYALPVITELGMWAFALAVQHTRRRHPDRPVWALQLGVWVFAAVAFVLNALHGLVRTWIAGSVMGVASVAGVGAHQLVTAAPRRGRAERDTARTARQAARKAARVRAAALRAAVAEIGPDGTARLLFTPGRYRLRSWWWGITRRLDTAIVPGLPVPPALDATWDALDHELADLLANPNHPRRGPETGPAGQDSATDVGVAGGPVDTLDRPADPPADPITDQPESRPAPTGRQKGNRGRKQVNDRGQTGGRQTRSIDQLWAQLQTAIQADPASIDATSAESIRRALRCSPGRARQLRDRCARDQADQRRDDH